MPGYLTKQENVAIAGTQALVIRSLLDHEQFHDPTGEALRLGVSCALWPIFGLLWPSGTQLASQLLQRTAIAGERILEVGCGLGLASLVLQRAGSDVTASDCHPLAGRFMRENERLNALAPIKYRHAHWSNALSPAHEPGQDRVERLSGLFDFIVGSDLLYERDAGLVLAQFIERHAMRAVEVWIVDPDRGNRPGFNRMMRQLGYQRSELRLDRLAGDGLSAYKGRLLRYRRYQ